MNYFRHIDRSQVVFDFFDYYGTPKESYREEIESLGGRSFSVDAGKNVLRMRAALAKLLSEQRGVYSVAHLHHPAVARFVYPTLRRHGVRSVIVHSHSTAHSDSRLSAIRNWISCRNIEHYSDIRLACSRAAGDFMFGQHGFDVLPNAVDVEAYRFNEATRRTMRQELGLEGAKVVGHVGRFSEEKNHRFLIGVFHELLRRDRRYRLLLVGEGALRGEIEQLVSDRGLDGHVTFLGNRTDVAALYQAMDIMLLPSLFEGLPMVGVESQCTGLPLVCSDRVPDEVSIGACTFLGLDSSPVQWAGHVETVLAEAAERNRRQQGASNARARGFDVDVQAAGLLSRYQALVGR